MELVEVLSLKEAFEDGVELLHSRSFIAALGLIVCSCWQLSIIEIFTLIYELLSIIFAFLKAFDNGACLCFKGSCTICLNATTKCLSILVNVIWKLFATFCTSFLNLFHNTFHALHIFCIFYIRYYYTSAYIFHFLLLYRQDHQRNFLSTDIFFLFYSSLLFLSETIWRISLCHIYQHNHHCQFPHHSSKNEK